MEVWNDVGRKLKFLKVLAREGLTEKVTYEGKSEGDDRVGHAGI